LIESIVTLNGYFGIPSKGFAISIYATGLPSRSKLLNKCELAGK